MSSSGAGGGRAFFSDNKRSEVNDLRQQLRSPEVQRDKKLYREAVQKVIRYMTHGIDVSRLFSELIMASATQDMVQKKLVYLYLCNYAESHSELTLLAVNTLQKNARDVNPMVRGLALRSMCSLRVPNLTEYVMVPLEEGLRDRSAYVRKTAVMGCVKLFYLSPDIILDGDIPDKLYNLVRDQDALVMANAILALEEILADEGGIELTKEIVFGILNRLRDYTPWNQCMLMNMLLRWAPDDDDEVYDVLNILDDRLKHANSGVVLAASKLFLHYTRDIPDIADDIYSRLRVPLITLMSSSPGELSYCVLHHMQLLLTRCPGMLETEYKAFFCRYNDPSYVKALKLEILTEVCSDANMQTIVEEFAAYVTDIDAEMARKSIRAMGRIGVKLPNATDHIISMLLIFLELDSPYVIAETLVVMQDLLRKVPDRAGRVMPQLPDLHDSDLLAEEPAARAAVVWMLGEFGQEYEDAPYILEAMIENVAEETSSTVRLQLLTATMKLFFKRPPECQRMLGSLLDRVIAEELDTDVHDRGLLYYRLLKSDHRQAQRVVCGARQPVVEFAEHEVEAKDKVFAEFNSLSVIYGQTSESFITQESPYNIICLARPREFDGQRERRQRPERSGPTPAASAHGHGGQAQVANLLGDLSLGDPSTAGRDPGMTLVAKPSMPPADFERAWVGGEISAVLKDLLKRIPTAAEFETVLAGARIVMLASSPIQNNTMKFFFYGQEESSRAFHLVEASLDVSSGILSANFKSDSASDRSPNFSAVFRRALGGTFIDM